MREVASVALHEITTVSSTPYVPALPAIVIAGFVASRLIVTVSLSLPPSDVAAHVKLNDSVSWLTTVVPQPLCDEIADSPSVTLKLTVTSETYHPFRPSVPDA